ncbi:hypothetical protein ACIHFB_44095 [Streptomyces sp. NPDC051963]|uniref:hypothetical protein n=1 Tax=Streptomyces sp. NPDC051963 TaxID=3365678 RepID=UPI0037D6DC57
MSRPSEYGSAQPEGEDPQEAPNVYHPQAPASPAYDEYADPASAHGWQDGAFDDTAQLPPVADGASAGRSGHRGRHRPLGLRSRRVMVAAGAVGAVSVAAVIAAFSFSGSPSGGAQGKPERTSPTAGDPSASTEAATDSPVAGGPSNAAGPSAGASRSPSASQSGSASGEDTEKPSAGASATTTAGSTPSGDPAPTTSDDKPGLGRGNTKRPKQP